MRPSCKNFQDKLMNWDNLIFYKNREQLFSKESTAVSI